MDKVIPPAIFHLEPGGEMSILTTAREEQDRELMQYAEKLARSETAPIDQEIQKLIENTKYAE